MPSSILAISLGASLGALLRWVLGHALNDVFPNLTLGTLAANLLGGYIIGAAIAAFGGHTGLSPQMRLFVITGFCGGLTTFSTFSAELAVMLEQGRLGWMATAIVVHVAGSLAMTLLGMATVAWLRALS
ncbi:fluoride efflux transporter CrcB [Castellaniella defragrans]|uniref:Fluoride-specific ion channel FluC n=2 Tax=Castellaniella defragrans TaxID=75697 RepID=W8X514_CASD6|nr:fluoride efflux transporter CrcB [Castellaniella defragrans]KAB0609881.1 fluoride efflux transporter CrcB [Castellaniella defragrans]MBB6085164.1 CrcB protein [Castellaniella defragrans]CDM25222.1 CrcB protein [Castellaniella defragrans 65Phen]